MLFTMTNGSDNLSTYIPLFSSASGLEICILLLTFYVMLALWITLALLFLQIPPVVSMLSAYGRYITPALLMALGVYILFSAGSIGLIERKVKS